LDFMATDSIGFIAPNTPWDPDDSCGTDGIVPLSEANFQHLLGAIALIKGTLLRIREYCRRHDS
jgi:BRCT domain type II-containing protein